MVNNKHLSISERIKIEHLLNVRNSFKAIGRELNKDCTTVSKEVKNHIQFKKSGCIGKAFNDCANRHSCSLNSLCAVNNCGNKLCKVCSRCHLHCSYYTKESCSFLLKPPYVCNGCEKRQRCILEKHIYSADYAQQEYQEILSESRSGISITEEETALLDLTVSPLIKKGQSIIIFVLKILIELCSLKNVYIIMLMLASSLPGILTFPARQCYKLNM